MFGRIRFSDNPWPEGHPLKDFYLGILLHEPKGDLPAKATLDLRFRSENYHYPNSYEEMLEASKDQTLQSSNWEKIDSWLDIGSAHANSVPNHDAMLLGDENDSFDMTHLDDFSRVIDPIPEIVSDRDNDYQMPAFHSHILSWDDMADHHMSISRDPKTGLYNIFWKGKCGKADKGNCIYQHEFELHATDVPFAGFSGHKLGWNEQAKVLPEVRDLNLRSLVNSVIINPGKMLFNIGQFSGRDRLLTN